MKLVGYSEIDGGLRNGLCLVQFGLSQPSNQAKVPLSASIMDDIAEEDLFLQVCNANRGAVRPEQSLKPSSNRNSFNCAVAT